MSAAHDPRQNHLLALPAPVERLQLHLKLVSLPWGEALYESGVVLRHVYFPTNSIVSLLYVMADSASAEIAGQAYQLTGYVLKEAFNQAGAMQHLLLRYTQALLTQMAQTAACNRHRAGLEARTCECYALVKKECDRLLPELTVS